MAKRPSSNKPTIYLTHNMNEPIPLSTLDDYHDYHINTTLPDWFTETGAITMTGTYTNTPKKVIIPDSISELVTKIEVFTEKVDEYPYDVKTIKLTFYDGSTTVATCDIGDSFSFDEGIKTCLLKYLLGNSDANKAVKAVHKLYDKQVAEKEARETAERQLKERIERKKAKSAARKARRAEEAKQRAIDIQTEAMIRALEAVKVKLSTD